MILVPIKNTAQAKQRLASLLDQPSRTKLAQAMLSDVMAALHDWKNRPEVGIVTGDPFATKLALEYGFEVIADPDNPGETGAIEMATRICVERGVDSTLVIPADIPLIQAWELEEILKHAPAEGSVLVPAGRRTRHQRRLPTSGKSIPTTLRERQLQTASRRRPGDRQAVRCAESAGNCSRCR